jgi:hypothetical protein
MVAARLRTVHGLDFCAMPRYVLPFMYMRCAAHKFETAALASEKMANTATGSTAEMRLAKRNTYTGSSKSVKNLTIKNHTYENETYTPCAYELGIMSELIFEGHETRNMERRPHTDLLSLGLSSSPNSPTCLLANRRKASTCHIETRKTKTVFADGGSWVEPTPIIKIAKSSGFFPFS